MKRLLSILLIGLLLVSCASSNTSTDDVSEETGSITVETETSEEPSDTATHSDDTAVEVTESEYAKEESTSTDAESEYTESESKSADKIVVTSQNRSPAAGIMTAGRWDDNVNFDYFREVLQNNDWYYMQEHWEFMNWTRYEFKIVSDDQVPLSGAKVTLFSEQGQMKQVGITDNKGKVVIYPHLHGGQSDVNKAMIEYNGHVFEILDMRDDYYKVTLDVQMARNDDVDIMFMIDTTGSMSDELEYLKVELMDVIDRVKKENAIQLDIRMSGNYYRDHGDQYLVRSFDFTDNIQQVINQMSEQSADGGGDYEEAVVEALNDAIYKHKWRESARAKLLFLVLDAPPHHTQENIDAIHNLLDEASEQGIRIIPIASSGVDKPTEFLLRFMAVDTGGLYLFLTDHSGVGNSHITPTIGYYEVEQLNDMLVDVINDYVE